MSLRTVIFLLTMLASLGACANSGTATLSASITYPMSLRVALPAYPNRKFSAYIFGNNALVGIVRSGAVTDASGNLTVNAMAVDSNNCATSAQAMAPSGITYYIHYRIDGNSNSLFVYPTNCPSDAGFLSTAGQGYADIKITTSSYSTWPHSVYYVYATAASTFNFSNTGLNGVSRQVTCSILDGQILNPTIFVTSTLGYAQGLVTFTGGNGSSTTTMTFASTSTMLYKYACWIDTNGSGTYNSGDLIASGPGSSGSVSIWTTVP